jgi:CheY-like chemotaxis protein
MSLVLIVDDNDGFRTTARTVLECEGWEVAEAATGEEGVRRTQELRPSLVLLDIGLPDLDGFAVAERIAQLPAPPQVILTSSRDGGDFGSLLTACPCVCGFIPKGELCGEAIRALGPA